MNNEEIAQELDELAELLEFRGENTFRVRAYRNGARAIRGLPEAVSEILGDPDRRLSDLPGIGEAIEEKVRTLLTTHHIPQLEKLRAEIPAGVLHMMRVPGLGAKKVAALHSALGIANIDQLRMACEAGKVRELKGFGAKTEQNILQSLSRTEITERRILWADAERIVLRVLEVLRKADGVLRVEAAGSFRRGRETVGDIDLLAVADEPGSVMDVLAEQSDVAQVLVRGETKMSVLTAHGLQIDLRVVAHDSFGAAWQYFTGSKEHNVHLRSLAKQHGLKLDEYGLWNGDKSVAGADEQQIYKHLGLPWIPPELREDRLEFKSRPLPDLLELKQLRGDLHMHTTDTDGDHSLEEMCNAAVEAGYEYIAITDHSRRVTMARGLDPKRLRHQWKAIDKLRERFDGKLDILKGVECDILESGGMDLPDDVLAEADWVLASVHYGQRQSREQITDRILGAIENRYVSCIAHPTGRLLTRRPAYDVDLDAVFAAAAANGTFMELNANPWRLDLDDVRCMAAKQLGILVAINTDAHATVELSNLRYGVLQARRGGLGAHDVLNTLPVKKLRQRIAQKRSA
jgi:DNA polymerase (family 10)